MTTTTQTTGLTSYYPEMGEAKPVAQIEARLSHYGKHWFLTTALTLKGRGISPETTSRPGMNRYKVTEKAFEQICKQYAVSSESLL